MEAEQKPITETPSATKPGEPKTTPEQPARVITEEMLVIAFVQGSKWWEYEKTGCTMWATDQNSAEVAAKRRLQSGRLGIL